MKSSPTAILLFSLFLSDIFAQPPAPRHLERIAFDHHRNTLIVFGGAEFLDGKVSFPSNIVTFDGKSWTVLDRPGPGTRVGHTFVYHEAEKSVYVISGIRNDNGEQIHLDAWRWNGSTWKQTAFDAPVKTSDGEYDSHNKRILIYGDVYNKTVPWRGGDPQVFELWEYKNDKFTKLSDNGPAIDGMRDLAYDKKRKSLVIPTWESGKSVVWEWKNETWNKIEPSGPAPSERNRYALAYDDITKVTYLFGGRNEANPHLGDFWKWNGTAWEQIQFTDGPEARAAASMVAGFGGIILYGGVKEKGPCNELWTWKKNKWTKITQ